MNSYVTSNGSCFMVTWTISLNHLLKVGPNTKLGDHSTPKSHNCWFILFYHVWALCMSSTHWNNMWFKGRSHLTSQYPWGPVTTLHDFGSVLGTAFGHFSFGLSQFRFAVTALGSCVKLPFRLVWGGRTSWYYVEGGTWELSLLTTWAHTSRWSRATKGVPDLPDSWVYKYNFGHVPFASTPSIS